ncbi:MAG: molecular chaperone TorD family protein [Proteobacteria bacterium]|nr:molecular chaperone TorD family protein [Pseudomonadota bacterium]
MPLPDTSKDIAAVYRFLAQCMQYPDTDWMNEDFFNIFYNLLGTLGGIEEGVEIRKAINSADDYIEDLQVEYTRLFINGVPHVVAPPYASVYMDKALQGTFAGNTLAFYREKGFDMDQNADLPDHLIHELEFLSLLAEEKDFAGEEKFLTKLFRPWYQKFYARVTEEAHHPYFRVVVMLIDFFTKEEDKDGFQPNKA